MSYTPATKEFAVGSIPFADGNTFTEDNTSLSWDDTNKRLSLVDPENTVIINGTTFGETLAIHGVSDTEIQIGLHRHSSNANVGSSLDGQRSRGLEGAEEVVQDGDNLLDIVALGHDGTDYIIAARIDIEVDGTPGNNDMPGRILLRVTPDGGVSALEISRINTNGINLSDGKFLIADKASGNGIKVDTTTPTFGFADILGDQFSKNTGATKPTLTAYNGVINGWQFGVGDEAYISYHIPHDYVKGTPIFLHIHWSHIGTFVTGGTITFKATSIYSKGHSQAAFGAPVAGTFTGTASTTQYMQILSEVLYSDSTPTGIEIDTDDLEPDGVIEMTFEVDANDMTVSEGAVPDPFIHFVDIHYQTTGLIGTKDKAPDFYA